MQNKTATTDSNFSPVLPRGELKETMSSFIVAPLCENMTSSTKPEVHNVHTLLTKKDYATATNNMYIKFSEIWTCGF